jgi:hypothetical protein
VVAARLTSPADPAEDSPDPLRKSDERIVGRQHSVMLATYFEYRRASARPRCGSDFSETSYNM